MVQPKSIWNQSITPYTQLAFWDDAKPRCIVHGCAGDVAYMVRFQYHIRNHVEVNVARPYCEAHALRFAAKYNAPLRSVMP